MTRLMRDILALKRHRAALARQQTGDGVQRGGLTGAVRTDERNDLALVYLEGNVTQRVDKAVIHVDVLYFQHCHWCFLLSYSPR